MSQSEAVSPAKDRLITTAYVAGAALVSATVILPLVNTIALAICKGIGKGKNGIIGGLICLAIALTGIGPLLLILVTGVLSIVNKEKFGQACWSFCMFAYFVPCAVSEKFESAFDAHLISKK